MTGSTFFLADMTPDGGYTCACVRERERDKHEVEAVMTNEIELWMWDECLTGFGAGNNA